MKPSLLLTGLLGLASVGASAQPRHDDHNGGPPIERLATDLGLNDQQKADVEKIMRAQHDKMEAQRKQMDQELIEQLKSVLTEEQLQKFQSKMNDRRRGPPPDRN